MLLFNEGEELGLVGARAFLADPLSRNVDSLINLEARGVRGPVNMFETSRPNATPIAIYASAVARPAANSLSTDVYRLLPNYTDVNSFAERGWLTFNLAPIGNETRYHSPGDDVAAADPVTLRHMGDQTLALAQSLANGAPRLRGGTSIFMDVTGLALVRLPLVLGAALLLFLLGAFGLTTLRRGGFGWSATVVLGTLVGSGLLSWLLLALIGFARPGMFWRAHPIWTHLATYATVILVAVALLAWSARIVGVDRLRSGFWLLFLCVGALIGLFAPGGIIFFLFPPLLAFIGMVAARWWRPAEAVGSWAAIVVLYVTWGAMIGLLEELLNGGPMWLFAPLGSLLLVPVLIEARPLIDRTGWRIAAALSSVLALLGWAASAASPAYSADRQQRFVIQHVTDAASHRGWWSVLNDGAPLPRGFPGAWRRGKLPIGERDRWIATAASDPAARAPGVQLLSRVRNGDERTLVLRLSANGSESLGLVGPEDAKIRSAGVAGFVRTIDPAEEGKYSLSCSGRSCDGVTLQLTTDDPKPIDFLVVGTAPLPPGAAGLLARRPAVARPQYSPDASLTFAHVRL
jgi:hypothetical protein